MHTRAAVAVFDAEASNKIVTGKVTSDRSMSRPFPTAGTRGFVSVNDRCGAFAAARVRRPSIQNIRERYFNNVPGLLPQTLSRIHSGEKNVEISNYVTSPRQKQPQISPIFISDKVTLHVSREKDGKLRLGLSETGRTARVGEALGCLKNFDLRALPESHTRIISICSDEASPNSTAREPDDSPCATTRGRTYRQSSRAGGRASTNMVEVLNPTVREPWQKLKEYFMN
jgi:hypothetical protein